ncbi:hypothetical protein ACOSP7_012583 [Xanthoceras sorbifolium]
MEEFIFGPIKCPDKFVQVTDSISGEITLNYNDEYLNWKKIDQLLVSWLFSTLSPSVLGQVTSCVTACEVWSLLVKLYSTHSMARIMHIRSQLQNLKKGALSITEFVVKMKGIVDSLTAAGGLGQEFDPVIATITAKKEDITLQEAQFLLMSFEARLEQFTSHTTLEFPAASANVLHRIHKGELPESFLREAQNFRGRFRGRGRGRGGRFSNHRPTCQLCGKTGHFATVCYHRYDQSTGHFGRQQESSLPLQANIAQHYGDYSLSPYQKQNAPSTDMNALIATSSTVQDPHWYIDSGATNHITSDIGNLSLHSSAYKGNESLAVGQVLESGSSPRHSERWSIPASSASY